jgi:hypothetical protein
MVSGKSRPGGAPERLAGEGRAAQDELGLGEAAEDNLFPALPDLQEDADLGEVDNLVAPDAIDRPGRSEMVSDGEWRRTSLW